MCITDMHVNFKYIQITPNIISINLESSIFNFKMIDFVYYCVIILPNKLIKKPQFLITNL